MLISNSHKYISSMLKRIITTTVGVESSIILQITILLQMSIHTMDSNNTNNRTSVDLTWAIIIHKIIIIISSINSNNTIRRYSQTNNYSNSNSIIIGRTITISSQIIMNSSNSSSSNIQKMIILIRMITTATTTLAMLIILTKVKGQLAVMMMRIKCKVIMTLTLDLISLRIKTQQLHRIISSSNSMMASQASTIITIMHLILLKLLILLCLQQLPTISMDLMFQISSTNKIIHNECNSQQCSIMTRKKKKKSTRKHKHTLRMPMAKQDSLLITHGISHSSRIILNKDMMKGMRIILKTRGLI